LAQEVGHLGAAIGSTLLLGLSAAALGSGAAITRAMTEALDSATQGIAFVSGIRASLVALGMATALAARGQGIVATMVSVNVIYIGSIAIVFVALLANWKLTTSQASLIMGTGFVASAGVYLLAWAGAHFTDGDLASLLAGLVASASVFCIVAIAGKLRKPPS
jgi:solute:Na+ symporter, SSS family